MTVVNSPSWQLGLDIEPFLFESCSKASRTLSSLTSGQGFAITIADVGCSLKVSIVD